MESGDLRIDEGMAPTFMYAFDHEYNDDDMLEGLTKSEILTRVKSFLSFSTTIILLTDSWIQMHRSCFTGPRSVSEPGMNSSGPPSIARRHKIKCCTPRSIAYSVVQVRWLCVHVYRRFDPLFDCRHGSPARTSKIGMRFLLRPTFQTTIPLQRQVVTLALMHKVTSTFDDSTTRLCPSSRLSLVRTANGQRIHWRGGIGMCIFH